MAGPEMQPGTIITGGDMPPWEQYRPKVPTGTVVTGGDMPPWEMNRPKVPTGTVVTGGDMPPWEQYRRMEVESDVADITETELAKPRIKYTAPETEDSWLNWVGRVGRSATFGISDLITARVVQAQMKDEVPDLTYAESLAAVREGFRDDPSLSADIVGALVPGMAIGKGITRAWDAATKAGMVNGALRFVAKNPKTGRVMQAMGAGAAGGMVEEFVRTGVDETIGVAAAEGFDAGRVVNAALTGALLGGIVGSGVQLLARGAGPVPGAVDIVQRIGAGFNLGPQAAQQAGTRLYIAMREGGETAEETMVRLTQAADVFKREYGYAPSMSDLMAPEKVAEVAEVARYYSNLDVQAKKLAGQGLDRALASVRRAVDSGRPLKSTEEIEAGAEDFFTAVAARHGKTPVEVSDEVIAQLEPVAGWVKGQTMNPGGQAVARVLEAKAQIDTVRQKVGNLRNARNTADVKTEVTALKDQITYLLSDPAGVPAARAEVEALGGGEESLAALKNLYAQLRTQADNMKARDSARVAQQKLDAARSTYDAMNRALDDYRANGLKISLSDANAMRALASKWAYRATDLAQQQQALAVRDAMSGVGVKEVPIYGQAVRTFRDAMIRSDAQATGEAAATGSIDLRDLAVRLNKARLTNRPRAKGTGVGALREGVREGAVRQVSNDLTGTVGEALSTARRVAGSQRVQEGLRAAAPDDADRLIGASQRLDQAGERAAAMARPTSPSITSEELANMRELATGGFFQNMGGAGSAAFVARLMQNTRMSRGAAKKTLEMLGDPDQFEQAVRYMQSKGADVGAFFGAMVAATAGGE